MAAIVCLLGLTISNAAAELKVAVVDMNTLLNGYYKTRIAEEEDKVNREDIKKGDAERAESMKTIVEDLRKLEVDFRDPQISAEKRQSIAAEANKKQELLAVRKRERDENLERMSRLLNQNMVAVMDEIRNEVMEAAQTYAAGIDVDLVFDESGLTTSQVPFLVYVRKRVDITQDVLKLLNKDDPAAPAGKAPAKDE